MKSRIVRIIGRMLYEVAKYLPESFSAINIGQRQIRAFCGKLILSKCGENVNIERGAVFASNVELGDRSGIGINARISGKCIIGNDVMMGPECMVFTANHRTESTEIPMTMQGNTEEEPVYIEDDVWIGARVTILPGVVIGRGTIVAAGAVVTHSCAPYSVIGGVPAKLIRDRRTNTNTIN